MYSLYYLSLVQFATFDFNHTISGLYMWIRLRESTRVYYEYLHRMKDVLACLFWFFLLFSLFSFNSLCLSVSSFVHTHTYIHMWACSFHLLLPLCKTNNEHISCDTARSSVLLSSVLLCSFLFWFLFLFVAMTVFIGNKDTMCSVGFIIVPIAMTSLTWNLHWAELRTCRSNRIRLILSYSN